MKKKGLKWLLLLTNMICFCILAASIIVPSEGKKVYLENTDISDYEKVSSIPKAEIITDNRAVEMAFQVKDEQLYGICFYFFVENKDNDISGEIQYTLQNERKVVQEGIIELKELFAKMSTNSINEIEIIAKDAEKRGNHYELRLEGHEIPTKTRVSFYANEDKYRYLTVESDSRDYYEVLYRIEAKTSDHPHIWLASFVFALSVVINFLIWTNYRSKEV